MRIICINNGVLPNNLGVPYDSPQLIEGDVYTVVFDNGIGYVLAEATPRQGLTCFNRRRFIPTSEIDEPTFERNFKKELV